MELFSPEWAPFTTALVILLAIGAIELVALLVGFSPSAAIDGALPDIEMPDVDGPDALSGATAGFGPLSATLGWLSFGRVPFLILLVIFLTSFALAGYAVQAAATSILGFPLNPWLAALPAVAAGLYGMHRLGRWIGRIMPRTHTEAASRREMVGSYATVIRGEAEQGRPAEAKASDLRGRTHYVLIEPAEAGTTYRAGDRVFLVGRERNIYRAITRIDTKPVE